MTTFDDILLRVRKPGRYLGTEVNAVHKDPDGCTGRLVLAFPDLYELGMSYLGLQVLYRLVNDQPDLWAERVFAPDLDYAAQLHQRDLPLTSLESKTPLGDFDLVGFSLQHELTYLDVLAMLRMGRIPLRASMREDAHPLVIAGGPCAVNPEPLAEALDAVVLGDAEPVLAELVRRVGQARRAGQGRAAALDAIADLPGVYLPARYRVSYRSDGPIQAVEPMGDAPARVGRAAADDLAAVDPPDCPLVANVQAVHDRLTIEIQRGCTRGCRFCQAGMINRPVRQRQADQVLEAVATGLAGSGHDQVSFLSLSAGDHPQILGLLQAFFAAHAERRIAASLPSLRAETLTPALAELVRTVRKSGFTIAPEAGTDTLRAAINKDLTEADVLAAAQGAFAAGWQLLKLYFMLGLPGETDADRQGIVDLVARVRKQLQADGHRPKINVGLSTFVPKAHTPFQWEPMVEQAEADRRLAPVRSGLKRLGGVRPTWSRPDLSWAEGLLARGDRRQFQALLQLADAGVRLAGWSEHFDLAAFERAFGEIDVPGGAAFWLRERDEGEVLPWDHLDLGPTKAFLLAERERAHQGEPTPDCATDACSDCGACEEGQAPVIVPAAPGKAPALDVAAEPEAAVTVRLRLAKRGPARHLGHREFMVTVYRALRRAGWPMRHSQGFHPKPRASFGPACQAGVASEAEWMDLQLTACVDLAAAGEALRGHLPEGLALVSAHELAPGEPGVMASAQAVSYRIQLPADRPPDALAEACAGLLSRARWEVSRLVKGRRKRVDLRPSLLTFEPIPDTDPPAVRLVTTIGQGASARPAEVLEEAFDLRFADVTREALIFEPADQPSTQPTPACEEVRP